jgi:hypothetical protein
VVRHGETEWSATGRHTSTTDVALTAAGEEAARALGERLAGTSFDLVLTSPRQRARRTAALAGFPQAQVDDDLAEWEYGDYEGLTTRLPTLQDRWHLSELELSGLLLMMVLLAGVGSLVAEALAGLVPERDRARRLLGPAPDAKGLRRLAAKGFEPATLEDMSPFADGP